MRVPNTPFATNLSSSGKETQLRIQNIFQWKKKRPPAILFLFTAMLVLLCCSLVSCQMAEVPTGESADSYNSGNKNASWTDRGNVLETYKEDFYTFLLLGTDGDAGNVDTIMVGAYDVKENNINVLSIPRDTWVNVPRDVKKISFAYSEDGVTQVVDEVTDILGFCPDYYIKVDLQAFEDVVNILGGIRYDVPTDMYYRDPAADLVIDLKAGQQMLDGEHVMQLVRYRGYANADMGRIQTQHGVLRELARKAVSLSSASKVEELIQAIYEHVETNMSIAELTYLCAQALFLDFSEDIGFAVLPGETILKGNGWYYELDPVGTSVLVNAAINPYITDITALADEQELIIPSQDEILENGYPTNDRGETYGIQVKDLLDEPDLQLAENADGILGYVRQSEINAPEPSTPEEAVQYTLARRGPIVVNMYLQDGETVIGTFSIG